MLQYLIFRLHFGSNSYEKCASYEEKKTPGSDFYVADATSVADATFWTVYISLCP